jgi:ankyrin repeat protein
MGFSAHATPLHQAAYGGHLETVKLLVARGARADVIDKGHHATPLGWAEHGQRTAVVEFLRSLG